MNGTPQIIITLTPDGRVQLQANIEDRITLYGLLEAAKDAIRQPAQPGIVPASSAALKDLQAAN